MNIVIGLQTAVLQLYFIWPHWSRTPANPEMEFFVTLVTGWKPQTNPTKGFLLHVAMVFLRCVSLKQILKLIKKPIKIDSFFLAFVWSLFLMNQALNNKYRIDFFDTRFTMHYKSFSALRFGHSVFTTREIVNKVFTILFWDTCILLLEKYITLQDSGHGNFSYVV